MNNQTIFKVGQTVFCTHFFRYGKIESITSGKYPIYVKFFDWSETYNVNGGVYGYQLEPNIFVIPSDKAEYLENRIRVLIDDVQGNSAKQSIAYYELSPYIIQPEPFVQIPFNIDNLSIQLPLALPVAKLEILNPEIFNLIPSNIRETILNTYVGFLDFKFDIYSGKILASLTNTTKREFKNTGKVFGQLLSSEVEELNIWINIPFTSMDNGTDFEITSDIVDVYDNDNQPFESCMRGHGEYFKNIEAIGKVKVAVVSNSSGHILARCLIWTMDNNVIYIDRQYSKDNKALMQLLKGVLSVYPDAAIRRNNGGTYIIQNNNFIPCHTFFKSVSYEFSFSTENQCIMPYMDTFDNGNIQGYKVFMTYSIGDLSFSETDGTVQLDGANISDWDGNSKGVYSDYNGEYIDEDEAVYCDISNDYYYSDQIVWLEYRDEHCFENLAVYNNYNNQYYLRSDLNL